MKTIQILSAALLCVTLSPSVHASKVSCDAWGDFSMSVGGLNTSTECETGHIAISKDHYIYADVVSTRNKNEGDLSSPQVATPGRLIVWRHIPWAFDARVINQKFSGHTVIKKRQTYGNTQKFSAHIHSDTGTFLKFKPYVRVWLRNDQLQ